MKYIAVDVGKRGGIAVLDPLANPQVFVTPKVGDEIDTLGLVTIFQTYIGMEDKTTDVVVAIEDVHSLFQVGAKSNFQFGRALGLLEGIVVALKVPFFKVSPKEWQKYCFQGVPVMKKPGAREEGRGSLDTKAMALCAAQRLYPNLDLRSSNRAKIPHEGIVDALLIAHYTANHKYHVK